MTFLLYFALFFLIVMTVFEVFSLFSVYGPKLDDEEMVPFLEKNLDSYELHNRDGSIMSAHYTTKLPYLARRNGVFNFISTWSCGFDYGWVPRWTAAHEMLEEKYKKENAKLEEPKKPSIKEFI